MTDFTFKTNKTLSAVIFHYSMWTRSVRKSCYSHLVVESSFTKSHDWTICMNINIRVSQKEEKATVV